MLVTGAAGFIGSHLVDRLLSEGHVVIGVDNLSRGTRQNLRSALTNDRFTFVEADLADAASIVEVLDPVVRAADDIDCVWHLAANSDVGAGARRPEIDLRDTFLTTFEVLGLMRRVGLKRIVFASTSAVYGESGDTLTEDHGPLLPISSYGAMKLAAEAAISAAVESHVEQAWICRFPNVVGLRSTHGIIYDLVGKLLARKDELEVLGDGQQCKPYLHVAELIEAMSFVRRHASERRALYNIGPEDSGVKVSAIAETVVDLAGFDTRLRYTGGDRGWVGDVPRFNYSVGKLASLGWRATNTSADAVRRASAEVVAERGLR